MADCRGLAVLGLAAMLALWPTTAQAEVTFDWATVGNAGNADDTHGDGYGGVGYEYRISKYEVTAGQYTEFLNAVAATDDNGLYNSSMWTSNYGCKIQQSGSPGSYTYSVAADWADRPVNYVSWYDAARFANWTTTGNTETGVYNTSTWAALAHETAAADLGVSTAYFIPTENEWYKAAYHKNDGVTGNYFEYPTSSDSTPSNDLIDPDPGNNATYSIAGVDYTIGSPYWRTEVGAHENSESPYGTFDQGGNVWEWNETAIGSSRGVRGGSFSSYDAGLHASHRGNDDPTFEGYGIGIRVASIPEPGSITLLVCGLVATLVWWKRWR